MISFKRNIYPFILPLFILLLSSLVLWKWPYLLNKVNHIREIKAFLVILPLLPYAICFVVILMGWRYNNIGLILTSFLLVLSFFIFFSVW